jgi:hypothetical protein
MPPAKKAPAKVTPKPPSAGPYTVAGQTLYLDLPERYHLRASIVTAFRASQDDKSAVQVVLAAALGLCWAGAKGKEGAPEYHHRLLDYGADVLDWLLAAGAAKGDEYFATEMEIVIAGNAAVNLIIKSVLTAEDLEQARGNSSPAEDGSTNSSA